MHRVRAHAAQNAFISTCSRKTETQQTYKNQIKNTKIKSEMRINAENELVYRLLLCGWLHVFDEFDVADSLARYCTSTRFDFSYFAVIQHFLYLLVLRPSTVQF